MSSIPRLAAVCGGSSIRLNFHGQRLRVFGVACCLSSSLFLFKWGEYFILLERVHFFSLAKFSKNCFQEILSRRFVLFSLPFL